jgi:hypothetical protein
MYILMLVVPDMPNAFTIILYYIKDSSSINFYIFPTPLQKYK